VDGFSPESPIAGPSRLPALFPDLPMDDVKDLQSDFDYQFALQSDIMDNALHRIAYGSSDPLDFDHGNRPMYPIHGDDEVLASDPYTCTRE
jgi:hypothetical protein